MLCFLSFSSFFSAKNLSPSAGQCSRAHCDSHGTEFGSRLVSVASALRVEAQRSGPTLAELCVALCAAVGCCVCRLLFGCLVVVPTWSTHVRYNCVAIAVVVVGFLFELLQAVQTTGACIHIKVHVSTTVQSSSSGSDSGSNYVLFALGWSCSNPLV